MPKQISTPHWLDHETGAALRCGSDVIGTVERAADPEQQDRWYWNCPFTDRRGTTATLAEAKQAVWRALGLPETIADAQALVNPPRPPAPDPLTGQSYEPLPDFPVYDRHYLEFQPRGWKVSEITRFAMANLRLSAERLTVEGKVILQNLQGLSDLPVHYAYALIYYQGLMDGLRLAEAQAARDQAAAAPGRVQ
jgi:hypothetical protein